MSKSDTSAHCMVQILGDVRVRVAGHAAVGERIRAVAGAQRGRASRAQLLVAGVSAGAIARRVRSGALEQVHRGVYGLPNTAELPLAAEAAALLACGESTVLSHHTACTLWGLRPGVARPVHVTVAGSGGLPAPAGVRVHRCLTFVAADICLCEGLPVTSPARTLLDVAPGLTDRDVERLLDEAIFARRIVTIREVHEVLARSGTHPGRGRLTRIANAYTGSTRTDSRPEEKLLALMRAAALPEPQLQAHVLDYRLDFFWPGLLLAVEVDAYGTHGSAARFEADRRRDARLLAEKGIIVLRLTKAAIEERPFEALGLVARAIGQREAALRAA